MPGDDRGREDVLAATPAGRRREAANLRRDAYNNWETDFVLWAATRTSCHAFPVRRLHGHSRAISTSSARRGHELDGEQWAKLTDGAGRRDVDLLAEVSIGGARRETRRDGQLRRQDPEARRREPASPPARASSPANTWASAAPPSTPRGRWRSCGRARATTLHDQGFAACRVRVGDPLRRAGYDWPASEMISRLDSGRFGIVNHLGHATSPT